MKERMVKKPPGVPRPPKRRKTRFDTRACATLAEAACACLALAAVFVF